MDLEEHTLDEFKERCESCGLPLNEHEITAALDSGETFLCTVCAAEEIPVAADEEDTE